MATIEEMRSVVDSIPLDSPLAWGIQPFRLDEAWFYLRRVMVNAEDEWLNYNGGYGADNAPCTYWVVGGYIITYLTDDLEFYACMLTKDMMDDLIIEEVEE